MDFYNNSEERKMNIYLLSQNKKNGWDTFDSMVVCAESKKEAILIHPYDKDFPTCDNWNDSYNPWCDNEQIDTIDCKKIGKAKKGIEKGVVLASFNAG